MQTGCGHFLTERSQHTATLDSEEQSFFESILESVKDGTGGWIDVNKENLIKYGAITASAGWGFYSGWTGRNWTLMDEMFYNSVSSHSRIAVTVGWIAGTVSKIVASALANSDDSAESKKRGERIPSVLSKTFISLKKATCVACILLYIKIIYNLLCAHRLFQCAHNSFVVLRKR